MLVFGSKNCIITINTLFLGRALVSKGRSKYKRKKSSSSQNNIGVKSAFSPLSAKELELRATLEHQVTSAFHTSGMALIKLNELRLYRNTHPNFEEFCLDVFGYSSDYAYLKMAAARISQNLSDNLPTNGRHRIPLPTRQRQLRPIVKAKLEADAQLEVWSNAVALAEEKIPSYAIVAEAVRLYLAKDNERENPFVELEVCRIVVKGNSKLKGKGNCWCIVSQVLANSCIVDTWAEEIEVPNENLESMGFNRHQYQNLEDIGVRMTKLHQTGSLDEAALWVLNGLSKLDRSYLTTLEEKLLRVLEAFYIFDDVE